MWNFLILSACIAHSDPPATREDIFIPDLSLVRGRVIRVKKEAGKAVGAELEIVHIYLGSKSLTRESFEVPEIWPFQMTGLIEPTVGEIGIWWVVRCTDRDKLHSVGNKKTRKNHFVAEVCHRLNESSWRETFSPTRRIDQEHYDWAEKIAQEIERVYLSDGHQRLKLLEYHCHHSREEFMVHWSIHRLERLLSKKNLTACYKKLFSSGCPIYNEIALDWSLSDLSSEWCVCDDRIKLIRHWMTDKLYDQEDDELHIINYYYGGINGLPFTRYLDLTLDGLLTKHRSDNFKSDLVRLIPDVNITDKDIIDAGFNHLLAQLRRGDTERRLQAARLLDNFIPLTDRQQTAMEALLVEPGMAPLAPKLRDALEYTNQFWQYLAALEHDKIIPSKAGWLNGTLREVFHPAEIIAGSKVEPHPLLPSLLSTQLMRGFKKRLRPSLAIDPVRVRQLISELDHDKFSRREEAQRQIVVLGLGVEPLLLKELSRTHSPEIRHRLDDLLMQFTKERRVTLRAIRILAIINTPEASKLLDRLASGSPDDIITREAGRKRCQKKKKTGRDS